MNPLADQMFESEFDFIDVLPNLKIDFKENKMWVNGMEVKLIERLQADPARGSILVEKLRVYVPQFKFEERWENFFGTDKLNDDEACEDFDKRQSTVILDSATRKPLLYSFLIDQDNNLYFKSKRVKE